MVSETQLPSLSLPCSSSNTKPHPQVVSLMVTGWLLQLQASRPDKMSKGTKSGHFLVSFLRTPKTFAQKSFCTLGIWHPLMSH